MVNDDVKDLFGQYMRIENEIATLRDDRKEVLANFKDRVSPKVFRTALAAAKGKAKLKPHESNEFDQVMMLLEDELCIDHVG